MEVQWATKTIMVSTEAQIVTTKSDEALLIDMGHPKVTTEVLPIAMAIVEATDRIEEGHLHTDHRLATMVATDEAQKKDEITDTVRHPTMTDMEGMSQDLSTEGDRHLGSIICKGRRIVLGKVIREGMGHQVDIMEV